MGAAAVRALAAAGCEVVMACRNLKKGDAVKAAILSDLPDADIDLRELDLGSLESVKRFAGELGPVDALFNNAGTLNRDFTLSADGIEQCVAVNCLAPFVLCRLIGEQMKDGAHIVNMVSLTCRFAKLDKRFFTKTAADFSQLGTYAESKLGLIVLSSELAKRFPKLKVNVSDPGVVNSNMISMGRWFDPIADLLFRPLIKTPEQGVAPALRGLGLPLAEGQLGEVPTATLFIGSKQRPIEKRYFEHPLAGWLWDEASRITGLER